MSMSVLYGVLCLKSPRSDIQPVRTKEFLLMLQFSEGVMNVPSEIAWGIIRDKSGFILKKRGELHQDDFS